MQMMMEHGPWLPGPGAAQATAAGMSGKGVAMSAGSALGDVSDKVDKAKEQFAKHGAIGAIFALMPPQATKAAEEATKPVLKQLLTWHWTLLGTLKGALIAIPVTGTILNVWLYKKHITNMPGICKFDITDLFQILLYDLAIFLVILYLVFYMTMVCVLIYFAMNPMEALGFISQLGIL